MTLPGVDITVAQGLLAALGDVERFRDGGPRRQLPRPGAVDPPVGRPLLPRADHQGGQRSRPLDADPGGPAPGSHPGPLGAFFRRLASKKSHNVAVVADGPQAGGDRLAMLTKNEPYRYAQPEPTQAKLRRLRIAGDRPAPNHRAGCRPRHSRGAGDTPGVPLGQAAGPGLRRRGATGAGGRRPRGSPPREGRGGRGICAIHRAEAGGPAGGTAAGRPWGRGGTRVAGLEQIRATEGRRVPGSRHPGFSVRPGG